MTMSVWFFFYFVLFYFFFISPYPNPPLPSTWCVLHYLPSLPSSPWMVFCAPQPLGMPLESRTPLKAPHPNACKMGIRTWKGIQATGRRSSSLPFACRDLKGGARNGNASGLFSPNPKPALICGTQAQLRDPSESPTTTQLPQAEKLKTSAPVKAELINAKRWTDNVIIGQEWFSLNVCMFFFSVAHGKVIVIIFKIANILLM